MIRYFAIALLGAALTACNSSGNTAGGVLAPGGAAGGATIPDPTAIVIETPPVSGGPLPADLLPPA